jgi:ATP-binding cassette subfamily C protein CydCD
VLALLDAAADLVATGAHVRVRAELADADARLARQARRQALGFGAATALITAATGMSTLVCTALAASAVAAGRLDPVFAPLLALVPLATAEALAPLPPAAAHRDALRAASGRVAELLAAPQGEADCHEPARGAIAGSGFDRAAPARGVPGVPGGRVQLHGVDVRWPAAAGLALRGVDLAIPSGAWVAVVGRSGAGKSTLLALLLGFLHPERGTAELPHHVTWCPQEPQLVSTTVRENLRLANPNVDDGALRDALRLAGLPSWTDRLDTLVGTGGGLLSGGEAQRLALARAVLAAGAAGAVLLDEPTAHVDEPTARELLARLRTALAGHTVVHVTHRPAEAQDADLVVEVISGTVRVRERAAP